MSVRAYLEVLKRRILSDERICPDTGEACRVGVCNYTPNSPCENLVVKAAIRSAEPGEVVPVPQRLVGEMSEIDVPDWFRKVMLDNGFRSYSPPIMDAKPMSKDDIVRRRREAQCMHKFGKNYLSSVTDGGIPAVLVGNPEKKIIVSVVDD